MIVAARADAPPLKRLRGAQYATAIAEGLRDQGQRVLRAAPPAGRAPFLPRTGRAAVAPGSGRGLESAAALAENLCRPRVSYH